MRIPFSLSGVWSSCSLLPTAAFLSRSPHPNCTSTPIFHFKEHWDLPVTLGEFQIFILFILKILSRGYRLRNVTEIFFFFPLMMNIMIILFNGLRSTEWSKFCSDVFYFGEGQVTESNTGQRNAWGNTDCFTTGCHASPACLRLELSTQIIGGLC